MKRKVFIPSIQTSQRFFPRPIFELIDKSTDEKRSGMEHFRRKMKLAWKL